MTIQIAFCTDEGFAYPTLVALYSLLKNTKTPLHVKVLTDDVSARRSADFLKFSQKSVHRIDITPVDGDALNIPQKSGLKHLTRATFLRLFLYKYFEGRVIYLDGDVLVRQDLLEFYNTPLDDAVIAAVADTNALFASYRLAKLKDDDAYKNSKQYSKDRRSVDYVDRFTGHKDLSNYFNAGISLFDLKAIQNNSELFKAYQNAANINENADGRDQIHTNQVFKGRVKMLPAKWNVQNALHSKFPDHIPAEHRSEFMEAHENPAIVHFTGSYKPWQQNLLNLSWRRRKRIFEYWRYMRALKRELGIRK